jgi:excisionase family DNA binding protein
VKSVPPTPAHQYLTTAEAAALLRVTRQTLEALMRAGKGPRFVWIGRQRRIPVDAIDEL